MFKFSGLVREFKNIRQKARDSITSKAFARLEALAWQRKPDATLRYVGKGRVEIAGEHPGREEDYFECGFYNASNWDALIEANADIDFDSITIATPLAEPDWYDCHDPSIALKPTYNDDYMPDGSKTIVVDLGKITA